jgi:steroid delta-isomerase-like uncharacterized protein
MSPDPEAVARRLYALINARTPEALTEVIAADFAGHGQLDGGLPAFRQEFEALVAAFPDLEATVEELVAEGDRVVARLTYRGTHRAEFAGIAATGRSVKFAAVDIHHLRDGQIVATWFYFDMLSVLGQLGVLPGASAVAA